MSTSFRGAIKDISHKINLTKYWSDEVITIWNMTHTTWKNGDEHVNKNNIIAVERFCKFVKENEALSLKSIAEKYCRKYIVPYITEGHKAINLNLEDEWRILIGD